MSRRILLATVCAVLLGLILPGKAAAVAIQIEAFKNGVSLGTAFGGSSTANATPLVVTASPGDTVRFLIQIDAPSMVTAYQTSISATGPLAMGFIVGSAIELTGLGFAAFAGNPNNSLNDSTPEAGLANSAVSSTTGPVQNLYRLDYIIQAGGSGNFIVTLGAFFASPNSADPDQDTAVVHISVPEPTSLFLVFSGLGAFGLLSRRRRKPQRITHGVSAWASRRGDA